MLKSPFVLFKGFVVGSVLLFVSACDDFLSSIRNENTQEIESLLYSLDDLDVCVNGAYGAFAANSYYGSIVLAELLGSDCAAPTRNPLILPDFTSINVNTYFFKYQCNIDDYQAGAFLQWGSYVNNNANLVIQSIAQGLPTLANQKDSLNAQRMMGEAYLMRAAVEYYNNFFVGRQYHLTTQDSLSTLYRRKPILRFEDVSEPRKTVGEVYQFLQEDLRQAIRLLPSQYLYGVHPSAYQTRCKKDVAIALLAKVFFQQNNFDSALVYANMLLGNVVGVSPKFPLIPEYSYSKIYQNIDRVNYEANTGNEIIMGLNGNSAFLPTVSSRWSAFQWTAFKNLQNSDVTQAQFRIVMDDSLRNVWLRGDTASDIRFQQLVYVTSNAGKEAPAGQWTSLKAAYPNSNVPWLRASEFHLMRAEIYLHLNNMAYAAGELNLIRSRAGLIDISPAVDKQTLFQVIIDERCREFCFENLRRWDNLRLASLSVSVYGSYLPEPYKSGKFNLGYRMGLITETQLHWNDNRLYCHIPENEYIFNPSLR